MNFLLTNDDGIHAKGIQILESVLKKYGEVYVCAPMEGKSGASCSLSIFKYLDFLRLDDHHMALAGNPVDCVIFGLNAFPVTFDLVISGCNNGYNLSFDAMYSGTIGACFQALVCQKKTIAFSMERNFYEQEVANEIQKTMDYVLQHDLLSNQYLLNVNFPNAPFLQSKGILLTKQYLRTFQYESKYNEEKNKVLLERHLQEETNDITYDVAACKNGYTSITPLKMTRFCNGLLKKLQEKIK